VGSTVAAVGAATAAIGGETADCGSCFRGLARDRVEQKGTGLPPACASEIVQPRAGASAVLRDGLQDSAPCIFLRLVTVGVVAAFKKGANEAAALECDGDAGDAILVELVHLVPGTPDVRFCLMIPGVPAPPVDSRPARQGLLAEGAALPSDLRGLL